MKGLPRLFLKHQGDESRIADVLLLPSFMILEMYMEMRMLTVSNHHFALTSVPYPLLRLTNTSGATLQNNSPLIHLRSSLCLLWRRSRNS